MARRTAARTAALLTAGALAALALTGCTASSDNGATASSSTPAASASSSASSSGFVPSDTLPDSWPATVRPITGFDLVGTFDKLAPATGATFTATWQAKGEQFDTLADSVDEMVGDGYKKTGEFESEPDAKPQTVSYTLVKGDWIVAYTATYANGTTVVNQMLIPTKPAPAPKDSAAAKDSKSGKSSASASPAKS